MTWPTLRIVALLLVFAAIPLHAQGLATTTTSAAIVPDSAAEIFFRRIIVASWKTHFAHAMTDTATRVFRIQYLLADSLRWARHSNEILQPLHGRLMTDQDDTAYEIAITGLRFNGDTLVGNYRIGARKRCAKGPWMGGATGYKMRAMTTTSGWQMLSTRQTGTGDTLRCRE